jgi:hypothetical protein
MTTSPRMFGPFERVDPATGFDEVNAPPASASSFNFFNVGDPLDSCPGEMSKSRFISLGQRYDDLRALYLVASDELASKRLERQTKQTRRSLLRGHRMHGGHELGENDPQVLDVQREIDKLDADIARLAALVEDRSARANVVGLLKRRCEELLRTSGGRLVEVPAIDVADVLRKGERVGDGIERLRMNLRENDAERHRVESACFPSVYEKAKLIGIIEAAALRGTPDVSPMIEHDADIAWPMTTQSLGLVAISGEKGERVVGRAQGEVIDEAGLFFWFAWLLKNRPTLLAGLDDLFDSAADDGNALSAHDRAVKLAEIACDRLMAERHLAALIWHGQSNGEAVEHARTPTCSPFWGSKRDDDQNPRRTASCGSCRGAGARARVPMLRALVASSAARLLLSSRAGRRNRLSRPRTMTTD